MSATKDDLIALYQAKLEAQGVKASKKECEAALTLALETVVEATKAHGSARTSIGIFKQTERAARVAQNPRTREKVEVPASSTITFKANRNLKEVGEVKAAKPAAKAAPKAVAKPGVKVAPKTKK